MDSTRKPRILLVEDNPGDVLLFRVALGDAGLDCEIVEVNDGARALDYVRNPEAPLPDLVVLDLNLPKASGKEILTRIRETPAFEHIPVVIWTSSRARIDQTQIEGLRVARYLVKPPEFRDLAPLGAAIKELLTVGPARER